MVQWFLQVMRDKFLKTINATFVRNHIAETWNMAENGPLAVENHGQKKFVIVSAADYDKLIGKRAPRMAGYAKHLFDGVDIDELLATPIPGIEEYMP